MSEQEIPGTSDEDYKSHIDEVEKCAWLDAGPNFGLLNDPISGRIPVVKIDSWKRLPDILEEPFFQRKGAEFIFRGQRKYSWSLSPTLSRVTGDGVVRKSIADQLLKDFRLKIRGRLNDYSILEDDDELWSVGQHHGLRTPLLDWTKSPYVALFFAFNEVDEEEDLNEKFEDKSNKYRCLYVLDKRFVEEEHDMDSVRIFEPRMDDHGRLVSQDGLFTISNYETTIEAEVLDHVTNRESFQNLDDKDQAEEIAQYICKIYIPNTEREACLRFLRKMNVHHASLFPDLIGASKHSNQLIEEFAIDLKAEDEEIEEFIKQAGLIDTETTSKEEVEKDEPEKIEVDDGEGQEAIDISQPDLGERESEYQVEPPIIMRKIMDEEEPQIDDLQDELTLEIKKIIDAEDIEEDLSAIIAFDLFENIKPKLNTDWFKRQSILAEIRNTIRLTFREYNFYISPGDERIGKILELLKSKDELKD